MPFPIVKTPEDIPMEPLLVVMRTSLGLGLGLLVAERIKRPVRHIAAVALVSIGTAAAVPYVVKRALDLFNRPSSERGSRARLRSIRGDSGYRSEADIY
ncbi:MAG: hypothetical protein ABI839_01535 [Verrucomicrobiota bacterium]